MPDHDYAESLRNAKKYFEKTLSAFTAADETYAPKPGMFTVAQQVAEAANAIGWFVDGAFSPSGFKTNFEDMQKEVRSFSTLAAAQAFWERQFADAIATIEATPAAEFEKPIAGEKWLMGGLPRIVMFEGIADHTAHHRGSLAVYARLLERTPPMPYLD